MSFASQLEHAVLIFLRGVVGLVGAELGAEAEGAAAVGEPTGLLALAGGFGPAGIEMAPLHLGHLIRFP